MTRSLSLMIPAPMGYDANRMCAALGRGPRNFSVLCYAAGGLMIGLHDWDGPEKYITPDVPLGGWEAHDLTPARVAEITAAMVFVDQPDGTPPPVSFAALAGSQGVTWGASLPDLPAPGSMATVTAGEFYRTDQEGFPVVKVNQTHARNDSSHTDLGALLAQFEPQRDPFNPAPWAQPQGTVGMYQLTNLIGGPELVTHGGQTWHNKAVNNVWEPGAPGTAALWEIHNG